MSAPTEFFGSLTDLRQGRQPPADVVKRARHHGQGGRIVRDLSELYAWMLEQHPEAPFFDAGIASGRYPLALAAFVTAVDWDEWKKHAVYVLHGEVYLARLENAKSSMTSELYRDNVAGARMHRANGLAHSARCAKDAGLPVLELPCWDVPRSLRDIAAQAVEDLRTTCTLRSAKYGQPGSSEGAVKAYQAALRNLADALVIHADLAEEKDGNDANVKKMAAWLRDRATDLALTNKELLQATASGAPLDDASAKLVTRDLRLADNAARVVPCIQQDGGLTQAKCARCGTADATYMGFSCRCQCLCADCVAAQGRVLECPLCRAFTEFIKA